MTAHEASPDRPDVVVEVLSESTRQRDFQRQAARVCGRNGVREAWLADLRLPRRYPSTLGMGEAMKLVQVYAANDVLMSECHAGSRY